MTDEQPARPTRFWAAARPALREAANLVFPVGGVVFFVLFTSDDDKNKVQLTLVAGSALVVAAITVFLFGDRESPQIEASRERVREAERGVEGALVGNFTRTRRHIERTLTGLTTGEGSRPTLPGQAVGSTGDREQVEDEAAQQERRDLALSSLWALTQARLTLYHDIATKQARRSFLSAQVSMILGFGMLAAFVYLALKVSNTTGAIVAGGLGAVSAALAGFISKTFVKSQQSAAEHLKAYFDQPLEFSRYLAAERLLADANLPDEQRAEVVAALVQTVAAGPGGPAPAADPRALLEQLQDLLPGQQ
ncbi:TRADD-N-associated membrane domain-containing protein [Streptomyces griseoincarnatus]